MLLLVAVAAALGVFGYALAGPKTGAPLTDFYMLGVEGKTANYPYKLRVGGQGTVTVGIVNHEYEQADYAVEVRVNRELVELIGPISLAQDESWEEEVSFRADVAGENQSVEFLLYKGEESEPYRSLRLSFSVVEAEWPWAR